MLQGIDVSAYQTEIDWATVHASGQVKFCYAKATEGGGYSDEQFARNHDQCKAHGVPFGAYHFFRFSVDPIVQAQHFLHITDGRLGNLLPMVDVEAGGQDGVADLQTLVFRLAAFNHEIENTIGKRILIYSDYGDWNGMMQGTSAFSGHPFFVAEYNHDAAPTLPSGFTDWAVWQFTSGGVIPGISGFVDLDRTKADDLGGITL